MGTSDTEYMQRAMRLAARGLYTTDPNPRVGCVIVNDDGVIVGEDFHKRTGEQHAEILALQQAGDAAAGATAYVTLEPCSHHGRTPPCADALVSAGVRRMVAAMQDPNPLVAGRGFERLRASGITVEYGLLERQAKALNPGFIKRMQSGLPFVRVKLAMSLDGRTAMDSGESQWITGEAARRDVQKLRARSSVILTGINTVRHDDPSLNVRLSAVELGIDGDVRQPLRVVIDRDLEMPADAKMLGLDGDTIVVTTADSVASDTAALACEVVSIDADNGEVSLQGLMVWLARRETNEVHVEAGASLCGALLQQGLVDEIVVYMAPHIMGAKARGLFEIPGLEHMQDRIGLEITDLRQVGKDIRITARPLYGKSDVQ
jgi:diaminohydroxyphosphoribosylaminopyrimidine deaminase / 5-amino-6-(5-phosphoribosylamino)uracil reductase